MIEILFSSLFLGLFGYIIYWVFTNKNIFELKDKGDENKLDGHSDKKLNDKSKKLSKKISVTKIFKEDKSEKENILLNHPWLCTTLKGHTNDLLDFIISPNGQTILTCSKDSFILIWNIENMSEGSLSPLRLNLEPDYCDIIRFSPDNKAFISHLAESNILRVFAISKKQSPKSYKHFDLPKLYSKKMIGFEVANCGVYILSYYRDCTIIITNVKGLELYRLNTEQLSLNECILSPCSRLFATRGATKGIKLWKLINYSMDQIDKIENFADLSRDQMVKSFAFSFDSSKIAFVNGGNSWKICELLDITTGKIKSEPNVIIDSFLTLKGLDTDSHTNKPKSRDKKIIKSNPKYVSQAKGKRQLESENEEENEEITNGKTVLVALAEECNCLALLSHEENGGKNLSLYNILNVMVIDTIFEGVKEDGLFKMCFYDNDKYLLIGHKSDKRIYVFHNVSSYKLKIDKLSFKKKSNPNDITGNKKLEEEISKMESLIKRLSSGK